MRTIFAHGPWYTEWHHLVELWPVLVAAPAFVGAWVRKRKG